MPKVRLTDAAVQRLKAPEGADRAEFWDTATPGLGLRVSAKGGRTWVVMVRSLKAGDWTLQRVTLGKYPAVGLSQARKLAGEARTLAEQGGDPADVVRDKTAALEDASRNTFAAVRAEFLAKYRGRQNRRPAPRTLAEMTRVLESDLFARWADRPVAKLSKRDVLDVLDVLVGRGSEVMGNRTLAYLRLLFGWAEHRGIIAENPADRIKKPGAESSRARVLTPAELRAVWGALPAEPADLFGGIVRVLMLTGQRRDEVSALRWSEIDGETWTLSGERTKNHRPHLVHLTAPVLTILEARRAEQTAMDIKTDLVLTSNGARPFSGFSKSKARLDRAAGFDDWTLHDLRRTLATRMAEDLRIPPHVIEATINHVSGTRAGVAGTYNRALYLEERKAALGAWADYVLRLVGETESGNVLELAGRTGRRRAASRPSPISETR